MVLAVLQRRAHIRLHACDVYASTVGGAKVTDPAVDLALAVAIASAARDEAVPARCVALGEIGLAGELRQVPDLDKRLAEAARLGVTHALVPAGMERFPKAEGRRLTPVRRLVKAGLPELTVVEATTVADALAHLGVGRRSSGTRPEEFGPVLRWGNG
jgi:DNA repair protein RadA/Sms